MDAKVLGQFGQRLAAFDRGQCHLRLEGGPVIASRSLHRLAPLVRHHPVALVKQGYHLSHCPNFRDPLVSPAGFNSQIKRALKLDGIALFETFTVDFLKHPASKGLRKEYLLKQMF